MEGACLRSSEAGARGLESRDRVCEHLRDQRALLAVDDVAPLRTAGARRAHTYGALGQHVHGSVDVGRSGHEIIKGRE